MALSRQIYGRRAPHPDSIGFHRFGIRDIVFALVTGILMVVGIVTIYSLVFPALHLRTNTGEQHHFRIMERLVAGGAG